MGAECLDRTILLGVVPNRIELEYGWILPGIAIGGRSGRVWSVRSFLEKPTLVQAQAAMDSGALWNTFVLVGKVERLWKLGQAYLPEMMALFERLSDAVGSDREGEVLDSIYASMPTCNFSSDLLQRAPEHIAVATMDDVLWSDWGSPERIVWTLATINGQPAFSLDCLHQARASA